MMLAVASALMVAVPSAWAGTNGVTQSPEIFYPNSAPRGDVVIHQDDVLARIPIMWASAARIDKPVSIAVAGKTRELAADSFLPQAEVIQPGGAITAFCTPLRHGERDLEHGIGGALRLGEGSLWVKMAKKRTSGQFCLFDTDGDGRFDEVRYFDSGSPAGTPPEKIVPVPFVKVVNAPVSSSNQDEIRLTASHVGRHSLVLGLDVVQAGQVRSGTSVSMGGFVVGSVTHLTLIPSGFSPMLGKKFDLDNALPLLSEVLGVDFQIVAVDPSGSSVTIRFPDNADRSRVLAIPEDTTINRCFGYGSCS